ncbi:MAG: 30S ribosomal protein S2 [Pseudomonadota bacterium]
MALPDFSMRQLLEAGVHFGHQTHRWNPKMDQFIFGKRNNIHILDLSQTVPLLHTALKQISDTVARGGRVLFVGTKRQASEIVADSARRSAQYYVNARWLGGMLTNWKTISNSIKRLRELEELLVNEQASYTKKELLNLTRERDKLERALGGIKDMGGVPDLIFVIDTNKESIAIQEARKLKIPVCAILDSNSDTSNIDLPIPGNDDAARAIALYCDLVAKAALDGIARQQGGSGVDMGAQVEAPAEPVLETVLEDTSAEAAPAEPAPVAAAPAEAAPAETAPAAPLFTAPEGDGDDLTEINGIGPVAKQQLNEQGITTFKQIAELTAEDVQRVDDYMPFSSAQIEDWKAQAAAKG